MSSTIGSVVVEVAASTVKFEADMSRAAKTAEKHMTDIDNTVQKVKSSLVNVAAALGVGIALDQVKIKIQSAIEAAAKLQQVSEKTGATVEALSGLASVARLSNTDIETLASGLQKLSKSTVDAQNGGTKTSAAFKALGISIESLKGMGPEEVFKVIALQMEKYRDGVEKTTIAQVLFGKAGANLLPVAKDLAVVGEYQVRVTAAQAMAADELLKNQVRLKASFDETYKVVAMELVPVFNDFLMALLKVQNANDGVKQSVRELAADGSIRDWAQNSAMAAATVYESVVGLIKVVGALAGSFQVVYEDSVVSLTFMKQTWIDITTLGKGGTDAYKAAMEHRNQVVADVNSRYAALFDDGTKLTTALRKQFEESNKKFNGPVKPGPAPKPALDVSGLGTANIFKDDPYKKILEGKIKALEDAIAAENKLLKSREQMLDYFYGLEYFTLRDIETRKQDLIAENLSKVQAGYDQEIKIATDAMTRKGATQVQIATADNIRSEAIRKRAATEIETNKEITTSVLKLFAVQANFDLATKDKLRLDGLANSTAAFQIEMLGKETLELAKLTAARQIELDLQERLRLLKKQDPLADTSAAIANAAIQTVKATSLIETSYNKQRDAMFGASEAFRKYREDATNMAVQVEGVMANSFKGMEDALVKFVTTGKLSFTDLANSIVADITRIVIKQMMMNAIGGGSGGAGWFGSLVGMGMGAVFGTAGTAAVASSMPGNSMDNMMSLTGGFGTVPGRASGGIVNAKGLYQVNERGPEVLSVAGKQYLMVGNQDATVSQNNGSGQMVSVTNNFTLNVPVDRRTQAQIASAAGQSVQRAMARNT